MTRLHLVVFGRPGSGKGTQARVLAGEYDLAHLDIGERLRAIAKESSPLGEQVAKAVSTGALVPDPLTIQVVEEFIAAIPKEQGFVIDGFPRRVSQADLLHATLQKLGRGEPGTVFVNLEVPAEKLVERLLKRKGLEHRGDDVTPVIKARQQLYVDQALPVLAAVQSWATVLNVNGDQPPASVTKEIKEKLGHAGD